VTDAVDSNHTGGIIYIVDDAVFAHPQAIAFHCHKLGGRPWPRVLGQVAQDTDNSRRAPR